MSRSTVSDKHPAHAEILTRPKDAKPGMWLVARIPVTSSYPCRCTLGKRCVDAAQNTDPYYWCRCYGRTDLDRVPAHCCTRRKGYPYAPLAYA